MFATVETVAWLWMSLGPIRLDPLAVPPPAELTAAALYSSSLSVRAAIGLSRGCTTSEATNFTRWSGVILVTAGNLYGNFVECGVDGWGGVSELTLTFDAAGNLYSVTVDGGAKYAGTVFELTCHNGKWTEKVLHSFTGTPIITTDSFPMLGSPSMAA
jgi:hypothetical protein